jgi:hypothetical protein
MDQTVTCAQLLSALDPMLVRLESGRVPLLSAAHLVHSLQPQAGVLLSLAPSFFCLVPFFLCGSFDGNNSNGRSGTAID